MTVLIVGAGVIGCAVARELGSRGIESTILDPRPPGSGATQASAGMLAPYVEGHHSGPLLDLGVRSLSMYDAWIAAIARESGVDVEYRRTGTLEVALDPDEAARLRRSDVSSPAARSWMNSEEARRAHPALGLIAGALYTPAHGYVDARSLIDALSRAAERRGASFRQAAVREIARAGTRVRVTTDDSVMEADTVVLASGAWTNRIETSITLPALRPVRGQLLRLGWQGNPIDTIVWGPDCYIVPHLDGSILVGATVEDVGFDERTTAAGIRDLLDAACEVLPEAWGATFLEARVGLRPAAPDDLPVIGPDPGLEGLVHASGHYRNGVLLAPVTAALIADWIESGKYDPALEAMRPGRF